LHRSAGADDANLAVGVVRPLIGAAGCPRCAGGGTGLGVTGLLALAQDTGHGLQHFIMVEGLGDVVDRAHLHRIHRRAEAGIAGHDQHGSALGELDQFGARGVWQAQVADDQVEAGDGVTVLGFLYRAGFADLILVALKQAAQGRADNGFVFDDKNMLHLYGLSTGSGAGYITTDVASTWRGKVTLMRVPRWRSGSAGLSIVICP